MKTEILEIECKYNLNKRQVKQIENKLKNLDKLIGEINSQRINIEITVDEKKKPFKLADYLLPKSWR